jgi:hypothetical protein
MTKDGTDVVELARESIGTSSRTNTLLETKRSLASGDPAPSRAPVAADNLSRAG